MAFQIIFVILSAILAFYIWALIFMAIVNTIKRNLGGHLAFFPLDLIDAKQVTEMVDEQVRMYLSSLMQSKGYTEEEVKEILTIKPVGSRTNFKR
jgi:hypothetical protein